MEHYGFFNNGDEYGQEELNRYFDMIYESGISMDASGEMTYPITIGTRQVSVGTGYAILRGAYHYNDSQYALNLAPDANLPKIYRVIIQTNFAEMRTRLLVRAGTAASTPQPPELIRTDTTYELSLGQYKVSPSGAVTLVKDERADVTVCGAIRPRNLNEYDAFMKDAERRFEEWFAAQQGEGSRKIYIQSAEPGEAVDGSIWIQKST